MKNSPLFATILGGAMLASNLLAPLAASAATTAYTQDSYLTVAGRQLVIKQGSVSTAFSAGADSLSVTVPDGEAFEIRSVDSHPALENDALLPTCDVMKDQSNRLFITGPRTVTVMPSSNPCSSANASNDDTPIFTFSAPSAGQTVKAGQQYQMFWSSEGKPLASVRLRLSVDGGLTYPTLLTEGGTNAGFYAWDVPMMTTTDKARLKIEGINSGSVIAFSVSPTFAISGTAPVETPSGSGEPSNAPQSYTAYVPADVTAAAVSIDADRSLPEAQGQHGETACTPGTRIKGASDSAVYYCGRDLKRHPFPNQRIHDSWFSSFAGVVTLADADLAKVSLGSNVTYRPGTRMIKIQTDPKVYVVANGGVLRAIPDEATAAAIYGVNWNKMIDDVSDAFFVNYTVGTELPLYLR